MPSTINADDGVISGSAGVKTSADASGELALQANGSTVATLTASGGARMSLSGNLTFSSTGQRITGDFSNATPANRLSFQSSTTNGNTTLGVLPNGTATAAVVSVFANSDPANTSLTAMGVNSAVSESFINANRTGTGTYLPMTFYTSGSERFRIGTAGQFGVGGANYGTATQVLTSNGPSAAPSWQNAASGAQDYIVQSYGIV